MKLFHLSDLHLGKRIHEFSMLEDQEYILLQVLALADSERPDAIIIAGDIYDKSIPSAEAVSLYDRFLTMVSARGIPVIAISGNHDSPERCAFGAELMQGSGIYHSPVFAGEIPPVVLEDELGEVFIYMLPFIKPAHVRRFFPDREIESYNDAITAVIESMNIDKSARNIIAAHQFVTGGAICDSEDISVGGVDEISGGLFDDFDYVALGHLHSPQSVGRESLRYCGSPLKYSFSEINHEKAVTITDMGKKGDLSISTAPLIPKRDLRLLKGSYEELTARENYINTRTDDYLNVILTDEEELPNAIGRLRAIYPNIMQLSYENTRSKINRSLELDAAEPASPIELFCELYEKQNNKPLSQYQEALITQLIEDIREESI